MTVHQMPTMRRQHGNHSRATRLAWQTFAATLEVDDPSPSVIEARDHAAAAFTLLFAGDRLGGGP